MKRKHKVLEGEDLKSKLKQVGIKPTMYWGGYDDDTANCFFTKDVTMGKKVYDGRETRGSYGQANTRSEFFNDHGCKKLEGIYCPDCGAPAWTTDNPNVGVCEAYPGWYFYYLLEFDDQEKEAGHKIVIINGEPTLVAGDNIEGGRGMK